ncbi:MAG: ATPase domain-containing protein [Candidatus Nitrosocaldus sp.]
MQIEELLDSRRRLAEIFQPFFTLRSNSLLIKGLPGTGKTTLALSLLSSMGVKGLYISTRVSYTDLISQFPWAKDVLAEESVVSINPSDVSSKVSIVSDLRLASALTLLEKVMNASIHLKDGLIILDSFDALTKEISSEERSKMLKSIIAIADANNNIIVFISERPDDLELGYICDGIISLSYTIKNGFKLRKMSIEKLRGVRIDCPVLPFSLDCSFFHVINPLQNRCVLPTDDSRLFEPHKSMEGYISTGNKQLDAILGNGVKQGSVILLEVGDVNRQVLAYFLACIVLNTLRSKRPAITISSSERPYKSILRYLQAFCTREEINDYYTLFIFEKRDGKDEPYLANELTDDIVENERIFMNKYEEVMSRYGKSPLITYDLRWREMSASDRLGELISKLISGIRMIRSNGCVEIIINAAHMKSYEFSKQAADIHIKLVEEDGIPLLVIKRPYKGIYMFLFDNSKGYPYYRLIQMV